MCVNVHVKCTDYLEVYIIRYCLLMSHLIVSSKCLLSAYPACLLL